MDYKSYKKMYTDGDMFSLSGEDFVGYAQYKDGVVTDYDSGSILDFKNTYQTDLFTSRLFRDRNINDSDITLPASYEQCSFGLNETLDYDTLKFKLDNIRKNNTYVFSQLFIASNNLPVTVDVKYAALTAAYDTELLIADNTGGAASVESNPEFRDSDFFKSIGQITETTSQVNYEDPEKFALFGINSTGIVALSSDGINIDIASVDSTYEQSLENILPLGNLGGVASNKTHLFVSDTTNNLVLKYDIRGYLNNDSSLANRMYINDVLGGKGSTDRQTNFNVPTKLAANEDYLAVYDSGNSIIKLYSSNLDFIKTLSILQLKRGKDQEQFQTMGFDPDFKTLYVLTKSNSNTVVLYRINTTTRVVERVELSDSLSTNEVIKNISFSDSDSNYWFYNTNKKIYKKYKTVPNSKGIGSFDEGGLFRIGDPVDEENRYNRVGVNFDRAGFLWNLVLSDDDLLLGEDEKDVFTSFNILKGADGNDRFNILTSKRFYFFDEPTYKGYKKVIKNDNYDNYGVNGFSLSPEEYIQVPVINNEIYKVVFDLLSLKNNIVGRFAGDYKDDDIILSDYDYVSLADIKEDIIENYFVHFNEENIVGAINRVIQNVFKTQLILTNFIKVQPKNTTQTSNFYIEDPAFKLDPEVDGILTLSIETVGDIKKSGENIRYKAVITNIGITDVNSVSFTEDLLGGVIVTYDPLNIYDASQSVTLQPNQVAVVEYEYTVSTVDADNGYVINYGTVIADDREDVTTELISPVLITNNTIPSLTVQLDVTSTGPYYKGSIIDYKSTVRNNGSVPVSNILLVPNPTASATGAPQDLYTTGISLESGEAVSTTFSFTTESSNDVDMVCNVTAGGGVSVSSRTVNTAVVGIDDGVDVAFIVDYTNSMGSHMNNIKTALTDADSHIDGWVSAGNQYDLALLTSDHGNTSNPFLNANEQQYSNSYFSLGEYQSLSGTQKIIEDSGYDTGSTNELGNITIDHNVYYYHTCWKPFQQPGIDFTTAVNKLGTNNQIPVGVYGYVNYTPKPNVSNPIYTPKIFAVTSDTDLWAAWPTLTPSSIYTQPPTQQERKLLSPWTHGIDKIVERVLEDEFAGYYEDERVKVVVIFTDAFNSVIGNNPQEDIGFNTDYVLPIFKNFNLPKISKIKSLAIEQKVKIVVIGPGVDISLTDIVESGTNVIINGVDYTNYYPWRDLAGSTGGTTRSIISSDSLKNALEEIFAIT